MTALWMPHQKVFLLITFVSGMFASKEIIYLSQSDVHLIHKDEKVGASEAALLQMLKIYPFSYGLQIQQGT